MNTKKLRLTHELPEVIVERGWRYHHVGIPYHHPKTGEQYKEHLKMASYGFDTSPYGVEWFRLDKETVVQIHDLVRTVPHVAFEVDNLEEELKGKEILINPHRLLDGVTIAMFLHNGAPIELMQFDNQHKQSKALGANQHKTLNSIDYLPRKRLKHEQPAVVTQHGWQYHHIGIPYIHPKPGETYYEHLKLAVLGFPTSPYGVEWVRFQDDCAVPEIVRNVAHVAFEVDDLKKALHNKEILIEPGAPSGGVHVAFILHDGAPIELMEFDKNRKK